MRHHPGRRLLVTASLTAAVVVGATSPAAARPGDLDPTFGVGGRVSTDYAGDFEEGRGMAVQSDGRIVVAGETVNPDPAVGRDFAVVRYLTDGSLDPAFGAGGRVSTDFGRNFEVAFDMAVQADGRIVAAGTIGQAATIDDPSFDFALARYLPDGSPDPSFGTGGRVVTDFADDNDQVRSVVVQPDGRIVVAGFATGAGDFALARYLPDGSLDPSFGTGGRVATDFPTASGRALALALQADGRIVAAGERAAAGAAGDFVLVRYHRNGSVDPSFGAGGLVITDFGGGPDLANGIAVGSDGRIVAAGGRDVVRDTSGDFALARYRADGTLDSTFDYDGKVSTAFTAGHDEAFALTLHQDGRIVAVGAADFVLAQRGDVAVARYRPDGSLDPTFGTGGKVTTDFATGFDTGRDVAPQRDGKLVVAGEATNPATSRDIGVVRYLAR